MGRKPIVTKRETLKIKQAPEARSVISTSALWRNPPPSLLESSPECLQLSAAGTPFRVQERERPRDPTPEGTWVSLTLPLGRNLFEVKVRSYQYILV